MTSRRITVALFLGLTAFWVVLSGRTDPLFLAMGLATTTIVTAVTARLVSSALAADKAPIPLSRVPLLVGRWVGFVLWMAGRILVSSVQIGVLAVRPRLSLAPCEVRFRTQLQSPLARTLLTNAISLVPGTITVDIDGDEIWVHALSPAQVGDLTSGRLQNKVAGLFLEGPQPPLDPSQISREAVS
ncbi:Na+/H+ antiporter subunit E [Rhabdothermincola salaria]|uniref:Na+/H+ antiporter subunit E n=1 Tax=Rhabdothermincola salaria TaxID=2903142 RepID=UPI001E42C97F|nr:Na+/H+ antiporter subunit E [Rhabdothermincola salaria]MCD9623051.1 Na+/H+ antiporter subunit E [Rhabdothermincola salaria]